MALEKAKVLKLLALFLISAVALLHMSGIGTAGPTIHWELSKDIPSVYWAMNGNETSDDRLERIRRVCATMKPHPRKVLAAMANLTYRWMLVDDERQALYCTISKGGSTTLKYLLLNATGLQWEKGMKVHNKGLLAQQGFRFLYTYPPDEAEAKLKNYYKYMVVRDPFDRLVSTHRDKFLQKDERCYRRRIGGEIKRLFRPSTADMSTDVLFSEFVKYVAHSKKPLKFDRHWVPQYYVCNPCNVQYDYIAKVESLETDAKNIFKTLDIPWYGLTSKNSHGKVEAHTPLEEHFASSSTEDLKRLREVYKYDMDVFGYSEPWLEKRLGR